MDNFKAELDHKLKGGIVTVFKFSVFKIIQIFKNHAPEKKKKRLCVSIIVLS